MGRYWVSSGNRHLASDEWLTPPWILNLLGPFDLDPCAAVGRHWDAAATNYTIKDDGLERRWDGRVWLNPPFGRGLERWILRLAEHGNGLGILPLRSTDTKWFHEAIWGCADGVLFLRGRVRFYTLDGRESGPCPHASLIISYGKENARSLRFAAATCTAPLFSNGKFLDLSH